MALKDKDPITKKGRVICRYKYDRVECNKEYIRILKNIWGEVQRASEGPFPNTWAITSQIMQEQ